MGTYMLKRMALIFSGLIVVLLLAVACGDDEEEGGTATPRAQQFDGVIKIGVIGDLSGPIGGNPNLTSPIKGLEVGVQDINAAGGVRVGGKRYQFQVVKLDSRSEAVAANAAATQLVQEGVLGSAIVTCAFFQQAYEVIKASGNIISWTNCPPGLNLLDKDVPAQFQGIERNPLLFASIDFTLPIIAGWFKQVKQIDPSIRSVAWMGDDTPLGRAQAAVVPAAAQQAGLEFRGPPVHFPFGTTDMSPFLTDLRGRGADIVYMSHGGNLDAPRQFLQLGVAPRVMIPGLRPFDLTRIGDVGSATVVMLDWRLPYHKEVAPPDYQDEVAKLGTLEGGAAIQIGFATAYYDFMRLLKDAIEKAGTFTDAKAVANALVGLRTESLMGGQVRVDPDHAVRGPAGLIVTTREKFVVYSYPDATTDRASNVFEVRR
ncbi:MAG TPA: ABC transporter substrate-binding protein [Dehalococcoidia bacterium]|nr:ABC transporter substrate-binding protein [Dehalococcoidia bacterium]